MDAAVNRYIDDPILTELHRLLPLLLLEPVAERDEANVYVNLPAPPGADYAFKFWLRPEFQIHARLITANQRNFWYMSFEDVEFRDSGERDEAILAAMQTIVLYETRIVQSVGFLFQSFRCEYRTSDAWNKVYGMKYFRFGNFDFPNIAGRKHIYQSPPVSASFG